METKTNKVKEVKPYGDGNPDKFGNLSAIVTFENGDSGFNKFKGTCKFITGQDMEYTIDKRTSNAGKEYTVIGVPKKDFTPGSKGGGYKQMSLEEYVQRQKVDSVGYVLSYASKQKEYVPEMTSDQIIALADKWLAWSYMKFDKLLKTEK